MKLTYYILFFAFTLFSCSKTEVISSPTDDEVSNSSKPNILLVIADDMGLDATPGYDVGSIKPNMPNLESMISEGIRFTNTWSYSVCTPTRASILTGKYGFRTQVTKVDDELSTTETSIQKHLDNNNSGYNHAVIGKWHLSKSVNHPNDMGLGYYAGVLSGGVKSYSDWNLTQNGQTSNSNEYTTTKFTDLAIDWIDNQTEPWFLWLAYNAPHTPFHLPPNNLHSQGNLPTDEASISANPTPYYMSMLEAMDTEMGRLLNSLSEEERNNTTIIFIGDNGTPNQVVQSYPSMRAKGSIYQGGVNVPMIISGKNVERVGATEDALINTTDLFSTIADIAGTNTTEMNDSKSFKPMLSASNENIRNYIYAEVGHNNGTSDYAIRDNIYKYIKFSDNSEALYNLVNTPLENVNLLNASQLPLSTEESQAKENLETEVSRIKNL